MNIDYEEGQDDLSAKIMIYAIQSTLPLFSSL